MEITPAQNKVVGTLVELIAGKLGQGRAVHPETAIAAAGRLSGSLQLRSITNSIFKLQPGSLVHSAEGSLRGPVLVDLMMAYLASHAFAIDRTKLGGAVRLRGAPPKLDLLASLSLLQHAALAVLANNELTLAQGAQSAALAAGFLVRQCAATIGPETAVNVAVFGIIEGGKTVPPLLNTRPATPPAEPIA